LAQIVLATAVAPAWNDIGSLAAIGRDSNRLELLS
jgi:hypothetical protein